MASEIDARSSLRLARRRGFISRAEGTTTSPATLVTVNGSPASLYGDATFAAGGLSLTTAYTATAHDAYGRVSASTVNVNISNNVTFQYDGNGNLTNDGLRNFVYDDENELIQVSVPTQWMSQFSYDAKMRRRIRKEFTWQGSWVQTNLVQYVYDGNLVIQERDINDLPTVTYTRGKDLSGSLEGAGGIGGLLARTSQAYADGPLAGHSFYHCDGNGNITMLVDSSQGIVAKYLYDAFGNTLSAAGLLANANVYRFSSKEWHQNSGLAYYLYRYYDPNLQRWPNRDPIGEPGFELSRPLRSLKQRHGPSFPTFGEFKEGPDLYEFVKDSPVCEYDLFGLDPCGCGQGLWSCLFDLKNAETTAGTTLGGILLDGGKIAIRGTLGGLGIGLLFTANDCYSTYFGCLAGCPYPHPHPSCSGNSPSGPSNGDPNFPTF